MKGVVFCGLALCFFLLFEAGTSSSLYKASDSEEDEVKEYLKKEKVDLDKDGVLTETDEKTEVGDINGRKYIKKTKVISTIYYFGGDLDERNPGETEEAFCKRVFIQRSNEDYETFISRVFNKYEDESVAEYLMRIVTFHKLNPGCEAWNSRQYLELTKTYYTLTLIRFDGESWEQYYERILNKRSDEDFISYSKRVDIIRTIHPEFSIWDSFVLDNTSEKGYTSAYKSVTNVAKRSLPVRKSGETEEAYCSRAFKQTTTETTDSYYSRIFTHYADETFPEYICRVETIRRLYPHLSVWEDESYLYITQNYYKTLYTKLDYETVDEYYARIFKIETGEDYDSYCERITIIYDLFPELDIWKKFSLDKTSKTFYTTSTTKPSFQYGLKKTFTNKTTTQTTKRTVDTEQDSTKVTKIYENTEKETSEKTVLVPGSTKVTKTEEKTVEKRNINGGDTTKVIKNYENTEKETSETTVLVPGSKQVTKIDEKTVVKRNINGGDSTKVTKNYENTEKETSETTVVVPGLKKETKTEEKTIVKRNIIGGDSTKVTKNYENTEKETSETTVLVPGSKKVTKTEEKTVEKRNVIGGDSTKVTKNYENTEKETSETTVVVPGSKQVTKTEEKTFEKRNVIGGDSTKVTKNYENTEKETSETTVVVPGSKQATKVTKNYDNTEKKTSETTVVVPGSKQVTKTEEKTVEKRNINGGDSTKVIKNYENTEKETSETTVLVPGSTKVTKTVEKRNINGGSTDSTTTITIKETYAQGKFEDIDDYYSRITELQAGETIDAYVKRLNEIRSVYRHLPLWYESKYLIFTRDYYSLCYSENFGESVDHYYQRMFKRENGETDFQYQKRIEIIYQVNPGLTVWYNKEYYIYTKEYYLIVLSRKSTESESQYLTRIFQRFANEDDEQYVKRIQFVEFVFPSLKAFYNKHYLRYTADFYRTLFKRKESESFSVWRHRMHELSHSLSSKRFARTLQILNKLFPKFAEKINKKNKAKVIRKKYHQAINLAKKLWQRGDSSSSSSSSSDYKYGVASTSSSSSSSSS